MTNLSVPVPDGYPYPLGTQDVEQIVHKISIILHSYIAHLTKKLLFQLDNKWMDTRQSQFRLTIGDTLTQVDKLTK